MVPPVGAVKELSVLRTIMTSLVFHLVQLSVTELAVAETVPNVGAVRLLTLK